MDTPATRLLDSLWARYASEVPAARTFVTLAGGAFRNDHIAFRSLRRPRGGIDLFAGIFERLGWQRAERYTFPEVHLEATYLRHPAGLPRVFISELVAEALSATARALLSRLPPDPAPPADVDNLLAWFAPYDFSVNEADLLALDRESQYAAWLVAFGREVNHFTASVDDVEAWQHRLSAQGVGMKDEIEGERGGPLRQTATRPVDLPIHLADGRMRSWPYAYLEIAERKPGFDGFLAPQARQLFEMTRTKKT